MINIQAKPTVDILLEICETADIGKLKTFVAKSEFVKEVMRKARDRRD